MPSFDSALVKKGSKTINAKSNFAAGLMGLVMSLVAFFAGARRREDVVFAVA